MTRHYVQLVIDSNWVPQLMHTPPFPEYPSGHSVQSSAAAAVLGSIFGSGVAFTDNTHNDRGWGPRTFRNFKAAAVEGGPVQGRCVARRVMALQFKPWIDSTPFCHQPHGPLAHIG